MPSVRVIIECGFRGSDAAALSRFRWLASGITAGGPEVVALLAEQLGLTLTRISTAVEDRPPQPVRAE